MESRAKLQEKDRQIQELQADIQAKENFNQQLQNDVVSKNSQLKVSCLAVSVRYSVYYFQERDECITALREVIEAKDQHIEDLVFQIDSKGTTQMKVIR